MRQNSTHQTTNKSFFTSLRKFDLVGILFTIIVVLIGNVAFANMIMLPIGAVVVLIWVKITETPWRKIGYVKPKSWVVIVLIGLILGITFKFLMKAIVMPLFGTDPINQSYHFLAGNKALLPAADRKR